MANRSVAIAGALFLSAAALSCTGQVERPFQRPPPGERVACQGDADAPTSLRQHPIRRLSETEYHNSVRDLFAPIGYEPTELVPVLANRGFENYVSNTRQVAARDVEAFDQTVNAMGATASTDADFLARHGCADVSAQAACVDGFVVEFGLRALRRPLTGDEENVYRALVNETASEIDLAAGIETFIASLLQSPEFLYRVEQRGQPQATPYEVASRLSYLLWQSMPDDELFDAAAAGQLASSAQIETQARRLLADERATDAIVDFHRQWFRFGRMDDEKYAAKSPTLFPEWTPAMRDSVHEEIRRFVRGVAEEETTFSRLFTDRTAYVNPELAELYGLDPVDDWTEVELPEGERSGILTRANFLAGTGIAGHGSPVHRGIFVYESLLCGHLGGVPDDVDTTLPEDGPEDQTTRELYAQITSPTQCRSCHALINPIGFTFENYTSTGMFRTTEYGRDINATGALVGSEDEPRVNGAVQLSEEIAQSERAQQCAADTWMSYMLGRRIDTESQDDACFTERMQGAFADSGGDMRELLVGLVTQPEFMGGAQ